MGAQEIDKLIVKGYSTKKQKYEARVLFVYSYQRAKKRSEYSNWSRNLVKVRTERADGRCGTLASCAPRAYRYCTERRSCARKSDY